MPETGPASGFLTRRAAVLVGAGGVTAAVAARLVHGTWPVLGTGAALAEEAIPVEKEENVPYGRAGAVGSDELVMDIYRPLAREVPRPAVVVVHGGAWMFRSKEDWSDNAKMLAEAGYVVFNLNYRLLKEDGTNPWPDQFDDVQRAVRWVRANAETYGVDPDRIGAVGHSSGGQMVGLLGTRETRDASDPALADVSSRVTCVVNLAGDMDLMIPFPDQEAEELAVLFYGGTREEVPDAYRDSSPIEWVDAETVPFLILQGALGDPAVEHSRLMEAALHDAGVEVVYAEFPDEDHISIIEWDLMGSLTLAFLGRHLRPEE